MVQGGGGREVEAGLRSGGEGGSREVVALTNAVTST